MIIEDQGDRMLAYCKKILSTKSEYILLWFMVAIYPFIVVPGPFHYFAGLRYFTLAIISMLALYILFLKGKIQKHPAFLALFLYVLFSLISTITAESQIKAWMGSLHWFTGFSTYLFCIILFLLATQCKSPEKIIKYIVLSASIVSIIAVLQHFDVNLVPQEYYRDGWVTGTIGNPNYLASYLVFILPAAVLSYNLFIRRDWVIYNALIYAGLLVTLTRFAWLSFSVTFTIIAFYMLRMPERRNYLIRVILILTIVSVILVPTKDGKIYKRGLTISSEITSAIHLEDRAGSGRLFIWKETVKTISENLILGKGPDHLFIEISGSEYIIDKSHNIYLETAVTVGALALIFYMIFLSYILRCWKDELGFLFFSMLFTYLVQGLFIHDVIMVLPIFWIVLGLAFTHNYLNDSYNSVKGENRDYYWNGLKKRKSSFIKLLLFMVVAGVIMLNVGMILLFWFFSDLDWIVSV